MACGKTAAEAELGMHYATKRMMAGFPHLYYMASPHLALEFLEQCVSYRKEQEKTR